MRDWHVFKIGWQYAKNIYAFQGIYIDIQFPPVTVYSQCKNF